MIPTEKPGTPGELVLLHYGIKGMRWGFRKQEEIGSKSRLPGLEKFSKGTSKSVDTISKKMESEYGFKFNEVVPINGWRNRHIAGYVEMGNKGKNVLHIQQDKNLKNKLIESEKKGFIVNSNGHQLEALVTHESAHAMYHSMDYSGKNFRERWNAEGSIDKIRDKAWNKAEKQATKDGIIDPNKRYGIFRVRNPIRQMAEQISEYASSSLFLEEVEAEIFTTYHWNSNPPKFVDVFMDEVHKGTIRKDVKPFSGRKR